MTAAAFVAAFALAGMRVVFTAALVADPALGNLSVTEALNRNWSTVSIPQGFSLVGLGLVVSLLAGFSVLLLCVGYILVGLPLCLAIGGAASTLLFRNPAEPGLNG
ncbi:MAG: hypothetical protein EBR23_05705 [Planctomycetia bacterium]|jgi:hypothetical protein|nr:hypothetical protein [Planctomycetia bacterium]